MSLRCHCVVTASLLRCYCVVTAVTLISTLSLCCHCFHSHRLERKPERCRARGNSRQQRFRVSVSVPSSACVCLCLSLALWVVLFSHPASRLISQQSVCQLVSQPGIGLYVNPIAQCRAKRVLIVYVQGEAGREPVPQCLGRSFLIQHSNNAMGCSHEVANTCSPALALVRLFGTPLLLTALLHYWCIAGSLGASLH